MSACLAVRFLPSREPSSLLLQACQNVAESAELGGRVIMLQAAIKYEMGDLLDTKALIEQCPPDDPDTIVNQACVMYKEATAIGANLTMLEQARHECPSLANISPACRGCARANDPCPCRRRRVCHRRGSSSRRR